MLNRPTAWPRPNESRYINVCVIFKTIPLNKLLHVDLNALRYVICLAYIFRRSGIRVVARRGFYPFGSWPVIFVCPYISLFRVIFVLLFVDMNIDAPSSLHRLCVWNWGLIHHLMDGLDTLQPCVATGGWLLSLCARACRLMRTFTYAVTLPPLCYAGRMVVFGGLSFQALHNDVHCLNLDNTSAPFWEGLQVCMSVTMFIHAVSNWGLRGGVVDRYSNNSVVTVSWIIWCCSVIDRQTHM